MILGRISFLLFFAQLFVASSSDAQLAEIKAFDTTQNSNAAADRLFADALKENILGHAKEAEVLFLRFAEAKPKNADVYYELARINAKNNESAKGLENIKKAISLDTSNKWFQELHGNLLATTGKTLEAATIFSSLAKKYTPNEDYLLKSSLLYQRAKNYAKAIAELEILLESRGADEDVLLQINQLYLKDKNVEGSAKTLQRLIDANPHEGRFYALLAEMYLNNAQPQKAKNVFEDAEKIFPNDISLQLGMASFYKQQKDSIKYTEYINKAIANKNIDVQTQITLLVSYLQDAGKDTASINNAALQVAKLVEKNDQNPLLWSLYGDLQSTQGNNESAMKAYKKSLALDNNNLSIWKQLLFSMSDKSNADSLILYSGEAISLFPSASILHYLQGIGFVNKGDFAKAISTIKTAIEFHPEEDINLLSEMYATLGDAYNSNKNYQEADKNFEEALKLTPENATVLNNYAYYLSVRKVRLSDAERYSKKSLVLRPGEATFLDTYAWVLYQMGDYKNAKKYLEEAIQAASENADATLYEHLGDTYFRLNDLNNAINYWQKALGKDSENLQILQKIKNKKIDE